MSQVWVRLPPLLLRKQNMSIKDAWVKNNNPQSPIAYFHIVPVAEVTDYDGDVYVDTIEYWNDDIFYHVYGQRHIDDKRSGTIFLGSFDSLNDAKDYIYNLTGEYPETVPQQRK